ncbi:MAG: CD225/dispanin family protein [Bacteroides sp.]|nr:CD225/dispanin family protein [Bacteroides sp.]MCM1413566.1 CD225/dispanin family protein [Bacteroides sp.]MCM1471120.1 CD225/dispanin family protein [Bacteroides sp.]
MQYWVAINKTKHGPLSLDEVRAMHLLPDTLVWHKGLDGWMPASSLPELADSLAGEISVASFDPTNATTPPVYRMPATPLPPKPPTYLGWSIASIILCCLIPGIVAVVYGSKVSSRYNEGDYEGAQKASERAELWLIISIVVGLVWLPFSMVLQMM